MPKRRFDDDDDDDDDRPARRRGRREDDDDEDDDDDRPRKKTKAKKKSPTASNGLAVTSLVLGILSFFCTPLVGIPAIACGVLGLMKAKTVGVGKGMAIAGLSLGVVGTIVSSIAGYFIYRATIAVKKGVDNVIAKVDEAKDRAQTFNSMKRIGLGMHNHHDVSGFMPRSYLMPTNGQSPPDAVNDRLSWRVAILPYMEQQALYRGFQQNQAWNSPTNRAFSDTPLVEFSDGPPSNQTRLRVFVGNGAMFDADPVYSGSKPRPVTSYAKATRFVDLSDGTSNTILAIETTQTVPWAQHMEIPFEPNGSLPALGKPNAETFMVLMGDGSARPIRKTVDVKTLKAAITRAGGEVVFLD